MSCTQIRTAIDQLLDGTLPPAEALELREHAAGCPDCAAGLAAAERIRAALKVYPVEAPLEGFEDRVIGRAIARSTRPAKSRHAVAGALAAACAASVLTFLLVGPLGEPVTEPPSDALPVVAMTIDMPRTINLVFDSSAAFADVSLVVELPFGFEIAGHAGRREVAWRTSMRAGKNVLPLELVATAAAQGELVARFRRGGDEKVFRVLVDAAAG